ncbi:TonB-dependent receptor [Mucilaginibacter ginsenosidivorax]|uniref:TonB-dependent receptor n=1 Tax=Mucilaginibacter ginsenosidivorax TaxID=862126 RepID=A0A5B8W642_9SPHI|nr:TonB-dependent receptor [Mucilaginibacter ginsenosidivorax]QEC78917.1 TonB-dependent receptor [Mucilaginibacter ginsenosidivorax]
MKKYIFSLLSAIYLTCTVLQVSAANINRPSDSISCTINVSEKSIKEVFSLIEKQTGLRFIHNATEAELSKKISLSENNQPVDEVLKKIAKQSGLSFKRVDQTIYVQTTARLLRVSGKVIDAQTGETMPGVSVRIKSSTDGTVTDNSGSYHIEAAENNILVFSFIGYQSQELAVSGGTLNVSLKPDQAALKEVVVVGYGKQSRKLLTSSIVSVQNKDFNKGALSNPAQLLQGKVAGLNITRSGDPNESPSISLRGPSTLRTGQAQEPFYVIDGVAGADYRIVAPDDIETIDVLKDASATAIYGTRAANGVILITTKKGKSGQTAISYNAYAGVEKIANSIKMMNASQLSDYLSKNGLALDPSDQKGANTDWQKEVSRTAYSQNHNVALTGGFNQTTYSASVNYFDDKGILKGSALNRFTTKMAVEQKAFNDRLKLGLSVNNATSNSDIIPNQNIVLYNMLRYLPTVPVMQNGVYTENLQRIQYYNPAALLADAYQKTKSKLSLINATAELKLPLGFTYNISLSTQNEQVNGGSYYNSQYTLDQGVHGEAYRSSFENTRKVGETFLTYAKTTGKHDINVLAGYSLQQDVNGDGFQANNRNFPTDDIGYLNIGLGSPAGDFRTDWGPNLYQKLRLISYYSRAKYSYDNKYLVQLSLRRDGSSAFGANNKWGTFPSASLGWRIIEESFMKNQHLFNDLKLRASYGITGNSLGFDPLISQIKYGSAGAFYYNGVFTNSIGPSQNANPDLKWEKTTMYNLGLDFSLFNGRLSGTIEAYDKKTNDLIYFYPVSTTQYFVGTLTANVGSISNKGYEVTINATPVASSSFKWNTSVNIAHNKNKLVSLSNSSFKLDSIPQAEPGGQGESGYKVQILKTGYPVGQFLLYKYAGKNANGVSQFYSRSGGVTTTPTSKDYFYAGNAQPKLVFGFNNSFTYGNFDLNVFVRGSVGGKILNATLADLNRTSDVRSYNLPASSANESPKDVNAYLYSDRYIESGSYLRLDNATLGYTFPKFTPGIRNLHVYLSGNNLAVITGYKGIDPEISSGGLTPGIDNKNYYPRTRAFLFGLSASF